ncbi:hypothetical protein [Clostridium estertheticum]|uniref:hypothetical protein n=1 Tax=Clostridium estertheticum TaxID=238834 RepID=UPI001C6EEF9F|nr:hypothetical protein [Clostridium estertheticum]MBW9154268.1 hypothetical protein [Clostridium estertheticum]WLC86694.1 hypothetical protein KTC97_21985 [Clostridium estertheticum]
MNMYEVIHKCGCKLTVIDETYKGGNYPYCKKCKRNIMLTPVNIKNNEFKINRIKSVRASADSYIIAI